MLLTVFVSGRSRPAERTLVAVDGLRSRSPVPVDVEVIDVSTDAAAADRFGIVATPTVIRRHPVPHARALGEFGDPRVLAAVLDVPYGSVADG